MDMSSNKNGKSSNSGVMLNEVNVAMVTTGTKYVNSTPSSNYLTMSITESMKLLRLLSEWNMPYLHQTCIGKEFVRCFNFIFQVALHYNPSNHLILILFIEIYIHHEFMFIIIMT